MDIFTALAYIITMLFFGLVLLAGDTIPRLVKKMEENPKNSEISSRELARYAWAASIVLVLLWPIIVLFGIIAIFKKDEEK